MTINDYWWEVSETFQNHANDENPWRFGQAAFNVLYKVRPDISEMIRSTNLDPFYRDYSDSEFWNRFTRFVFEHWES